MELAELKKNLQASIEEIEDENLLLKVKIVIENETDAEDIVYEDSPAFITVLNESIQQADNGEIHCDEETTKWLNDRAWRTK